MKPKLACDLDGVIFNVVPEYIKEINKKLGTRYRREDLHEYSFGKAWGIPSEVVWACVDKVLGRDYVPVHEDATELFNVKDVVKPPLIFLTARKEQFLSPTKKHIYSVFKDKLPYVLIHNKGKGAVCRDLDILYMIEDLPCYAKEIVDTSPNTIVLMVKRAYNLGIKHSRIWYIQSLRAVKPIVTMGGGEPDDYEAA